MKYYWNCIKKITWHYLKIRWIVSTTSFVKNFFTHVLKPPSNSIHTVRIKTQTRNNVRIQQSYSPSQYPSQVSYIKNEKNATFITAWGISRRTSCIPNQHSFQVPPPPSPTYPHLPVNPYILHHRKLKKLIVSTSPNPPSTP